MRNVDCLELSKLRSYKVNYYCEGSNFHIDALEDLGQKGGTALNHKKIIDKLGFKKKYFFGTDLSF